MVLGPRARIDPSGEDNPLTHEHYLDCPNLTGLTAEWFLDEERNLCRSDWHTDVIYKAFGDDLDVTVGDTIVGSEIFKLSFSASPRQNEVTAAGEMKWLAGRTYEARYKVYWTE